MSKQERRRYFRIQDTVGMKAEPVPSSELKERLDDFWNNRHDFSIRNEFNHQLEEHLADLAAIERKYPAIARYLKVLQNQVDLLSEHIISDDELHDRERREVNISAQGISFLTSESLLIGDVVEINLQLLPNRQQIVVFAKVVSCDDMGDSQFKLTVDFEHIHEADREILVKHIHGKQLQSLGAARFKDNK